MKNQHKVIYSILMVYCLGLGINPAVAIDQKVRANSINEKSNNRKIKDASIIAEPITIFPFLTELEILDEVAPATFESGTPISLTFTQGQSVYAVVDGDAGPITFSFMGTSHTEHTAPFHMNGDNNYVSFPAGIHAIGIQTPDYNYSVFIDVDMALVVDEPEVEEPIVEEPIVEEPVVQEPIVEEPTVELVNSIPIPTVLKILHGIAPLVFESSTALDLTYAQGQSVYAEVDGDAGPITFSFMGISHTENSAPYHMNGDNNYVSFPAGIHEIGIQTPDYNYSVFIDVDMALAVDEPIVEEPVVEEKIVEEPVLELVNSIPIPTMLEILHGTAPLVFESSTAINLTYAQGQSVYAVVDGDAGPITFSFMGISHTENNAPFHMNGDNNYVSFPAGIHEIGIQGPDYNYSVLIDVSVAVEVDEPVVSQVPTYKVQAGEFNLYPRETNGWDETGWSIVTPSNDSRLIYVSSSVGDDDTAEYYAPNDVSDIQYPDIIRPFRSVHAALDSVRDGYPDWILLLGGDSWELTDRVELKSGRSVTERSVITSYGSGTERPTLKSNESEILRIWAEVSYVAIVGLALKAHKREPESLGFSGWGNVSDSIGLRVYTPEGVTAGSILIEGNYFNYFTKGISINGRGSHHDMVVRRNIVRNSYSEKIHAQGMYASHASVLLEENIFDHNGWYNKQEGSGNETAEGQATMFNHNTYFSEAFHSRFIRNIFLRSSSIQNKWAANSDKYGAVDSIESHDLWMEENIYVGGEIGISAGGNTDHDTGPRWENVTILNNVFLAIGRDQPTNRTLGWYIDASDWKNGSICGNYLLENDNALVTNLYGINLAGHNSSVSISENTIYGLMRSDPGNNTAAITIDSQEKTDVVVKGNNVQLAGSNMRVLLADNTSSISLEGNKYFSNADADMWFKANGSDENFDSWTIITGETNSIVGEDFFTQPGRSFETYLSVIGASASIETFVDRVANQFKDSWAPELTATAISDYIRGGYGGLTCAQ